MPLHFSAILEEVATSITQSAADQLRERALRGAKLDVLSRAIRKANKSFLALFEAEFDRCGFASLLRDSTRSSLAVFIKQDAVQETLAEPFRDGTTFNTHKLASLWQEIRLAGSAKLVDLPREFVWTNLSPQYVESVRSIIAEDPELREACKFIHDFPPIKPFDLDRYRQILKEEFGTLKLSAIYGDSDSSSHRGQISLRSVYIPPQLVEGFPFRDSRKQEPERSEPFATEEYQRTFPRTLYDLLADSSCQRLVIIGDPGLGKSVLLQHIALSWAHGKSSAIPFLIELRKYTRDQSHPHNFPEYLEKGTSFQCNIPMDELERYIREADTVVMFDGLDEIFDTELRGEIVTAITNFARHHTRARIIVTTRTAGYVTDPLNSENFLRAGFRQFSLQDFDSREIQEFIGKWFQAVLPGAISEQQQLARRLSLALQESPSFRELAGNPLLLTMMVLLNRRERLPLERVKFYDACAQLLVEGWDAKRHLVDPNCLGQDDKLEILQRLAFEMQRSGTLENMISEEKLLPIFEAALKARDVEHPRIVARKILGSLAERDFMLCSAGAKQYAFIHRTFLEYFIARGFRGRLDDSDGESNVLDLFRRKAHEEGWRDVLRLICALVRPDLVQKLVFQLLPAKVAENDWQVIFLVADCLSEVPRLDIVEAERVVTRSKLLTLLEFNFPYPYNLGDEEMKTVAQVRGGAVERLARGWREESTRQWLFGLPAQHYDRTIRETAVRELARGWPDETTRQWLANCNSQQQGVLLPAIREMARGWRTETTRQWLSAIVSQNTDDVVRLAAMHELASGWQEENTRQWLLGYATQETNINLRRGAVRELARGWRNEATWRWLLDCSDMDVNIRMAVTWELALGWRDETTRQFVLDRASSTKSIEGTLAVMSLARSWRDESTREWLLERLSEKKESTLRPTIVHELAQGWPEESTRQLLLDRAIKDLEAPVRGAAVYELAKCWPDVITWQVLFERVTQDANASVRSAALRGLARGWPDAKTLALLLQHGIQDEDALVRRAAIEQLARGWRKDSVRAALLERAINDNDKMVRATAITGLARGWRDNSTRQLFEQSLNDDALAVRSAAQRALACGWPNDQAALAVAKNRSVDKT